MHGSLEDHEMNGENKPTDAVFKGGNNAATYLIILGIAALMLFLGISGMLKERIDLSEGFEGGFEKGDYYSGVPECGLDTAYLDLSHSINGIKVAHEYFYIITNEDMTSAISVRAGKDFAKNFNEEYENTGKVKVTGKIRKLPREAEDSLASMVIDGKRAGIEIDGYYYIDTKSGMLNIVKIAVGAINVAIAILFAVSSSIKRKAFENGERKLTTPAGTIAAFLLIVAGIGIIYLMLMSF